MSKNSILSDFFNSLTIQEEKIYPILENDKSGMIFRSAINELNLMNYKGISEYNGTLGQDEYYYIFKLGVSRLLKITLEKNKNFDLPAVMFLRDSVISEETHYIVKGLGMIEHGRRVGQSVNSGYSEIDKDGKNSFKITLSSNLIDEENYENTLSYLCKKNNLRKRNIFLSSEYIKKLNKEMSNKMIELVYIYNNHFIGYNSDPILDEYYFALAYNELSNQDGFDTFHFSAKIGGITFQNYKLAIAFIMSVITKHEKFAESLIIKEPSILIENILTTSLDSEEFIEHMCIAINYFESQLQEHSPLELRDAKKIFEVLSYSRSNIKVLDRPSAELPMLIQSSKSNFFCCIAARYSAPLQYLHDSLRFNFSKEYDKLQQSREKSLQNTIKIIFDNNFNGLKRIDNIKIKENGKIKTDIDLIIIEEKTGSVFLCQLKHQDLYGSDIHAKHIRTTRLKEQASYWLSTINSWLDKTSNEKIRKTLQINSKLKNLKFYKIFITRHYAFSLKDISKSNDTAYFNLLQLFNTIKEAIQDNKSTEKSISIIIEKSKELETTFGNIKYIKEPQSIWKIDDLCFSVIHG